ncbi:protein disulfide isomerase CRELD2 isoform X2 [Excalfactoria chinensis]|uniref:protein disulfide isomerase CRELD2 isoform X2 n=1 Tax=Excalfactoria chinensis TaxID=46218 RepID=UPI003B3B682D
MGLAGRCRSGCYGARGGARRCCGAALRRAGSAAGPPRALSFRAALAMGPGLAPRSPLPALYAALLLLLLLPPPPAMGAGERRRLACSTCRGIVDRFNQGLADTAKKNFGGGNTAWEEKTLSKYESSEIRLVEITENLCDSSNFECNNMVEEHEEHIEKWWFKLKKKYPDLFKWFCIETLEVCCPPGTYGPDCLACRGGSERPCHGNGRCDGDGTRGGDGTCSCNREYTGEFCMDCSNGYYSSLRNDTHSVCTDLDECASSPCKDEQYCLNTDGSFSCKACDASCVGCTGEGSDKCKTCASGYMKEDEKCADIDECNLSEKVCTKENEDCVNTPGSYKCVCSEGFEDKDGTCVQTVKTGEEMETEATDPSHTGHDDL